MNYKEILNKFILKLLLYSLFLILNFIRFFILTNTYNYPGLPFFLLVIWLFFLARSRYLPFDNQTFKQFNYRFSAKKQYQQFLTFETVCKIQKHLQSMYLICFFMDWYMTKFKQNKCFCQKHNLNYLLSSIFLWPFHLTNCFKTTEKKHIFTVNHICKKYT